MGELIRCVDCGYCGRLEGQFHCLQNNQPICNPNKEGCNDGFPDHEEVVNARNIWGT